MKNLDKIIHDSKGLRNTTYGIAIFSLVVFCYMRFKYDEPSDLTFIFLSMTFYWIGRIAQNQYSFYLLTKEKEGTEPTAGEE